MTDKSVSVRSFWLVATLFFLCVAAVVILQQPLWLIIPCILILTPVLLKNPRLIYFCLLFTIPLSSELMVTETLGTDFPDEALMVIVSVVVLIMLANDPAVISKRFYDHTLFLFLCFHFAWIIVSAVFSDNTFLSTKYILAKAWYIIPFVFATQIFIRGKRSMVMIGCLFLIPVFLIAVQTIARHASEGFSFEGIKTTLSPFFRNHVVYGAVLACMLPVIAGFIYLSEIRRVRNYFTILGIFFLLALLLSYSRGAWLAVLVAAIIAWAVHKRIVKWILLTGALLITGVFVWLGNNNRYLDFRPDHDRTIFHKNFNEHMLATYRLQDVSNAERFYRWIAAIRMSADNPVTGTGPNTFYECYKPYTVAAYKTWVSHNEDHSTAHNYFLLLLAEQGIPGLLIFLFLVYFMFLYAERIYHQSADKFYKTVGLIISAVLAIIITENFLNDFIETDKMGGLFFLCLGLLIMMDLKQTTSKTA